ncbi:MAG: hypothetical protein ACHQ1G_11485 [Planctomycetota bacterium]
MWRIAVAGVLLAVGIWFAIDAIITTDAERVEAEVERLVALGRQGGEAAASGILDALADDYRGSGVYSRESIEGYARRALLAEPPEELWTGDYTALPKGDEILVPLLRVHVRAKGFEADAIVRVWFAKRDGRFRIVNVEHWGLER